MKIGYYGKALWIIVLITALTACNGSKKEKQVGPPEIPVVEAIQEDIPLKKQFVGEIYGISDIPIRARVEGWLDVISFKEGQMVNKGQVLYKIDPRPLQTEVNAALSDLAAAKTMLAKAESDYNRYKPLAEINAVSQSDLDWAKAQYEAAQASVEAAQASLELARIKIGYTTIYSPIDGIIGKTQAKVGEFVGRSPNPVILNTVSRIDTVRVEFFLTEADYLVIAKRILKDDTVAPEKMPKRQEELRKLNLILSDGSVHPYQGTIDFIDRQVNAQSGAFLVQASFPNPTGILRPGQFARLDATMDIANDAILIPQQCIMELQGIFQVFVVAADSTIEIRQIKVGPTYLDYWLVLEGLQHGDKVVLEGLQKLKSGMTITPVIKEYVSKTKTTP